jgi:hypothetical protein
VPILSSQLLFHKDGNWTDFLAISAEAYWRRGTALRVTLPLCERIREGFKESAYIWEAHYKNKGSAPIDQCLAFYEEWNERVAKGEVTLDYEAKHEVCATEHLSFAKLTHHRSGDPIVHTYYIIIMSCIETSKSRSRKTTFSMFMFEKRIAELEAGIVG